MQNAVKKLGLPVVVLALAVVVVWLMVNSKKPPSRHAATPDVPMVAVKAIALGDVPVPISTRGIVAAKRQIDLVSEVSGQIEKVSPYLVAGTLVPSGTELVRIDPLKYEVAVIEAEASVASAQLALKEAKVLLKKATVNEAKIKLKAAEARLRQAKDSLANTVVIAPYDVLVDAKYTDNGQYVSTGTALTRLIDSSVLEVRLPLLPADVPFVKVGEKDNGDWYTVTLIAQQGSLQATWPAKLVRKEQRVDSDTQVSYVVAEVEQPYNATRYEQVLPVGQFVTAIIENSVISQAVALPRTALHEGRFVFVYEQGKLKQVDVGVLRAGGDEVIVNAGLKTGDNVVISRLGFMVDGMEVRTHEG